MGQPTFEELVEREHKYPGSVSGIRMQGDEDDEDEDDEEEDDGDDDDDDDEGGEE